MKVKPIPVIDYDEFEDEYFSRFPQDDRPLGYLFPFCSNYSYQHLSLVYWSILDDKVPMNADYGYIDDWEDTLTQQERKRLNECKERIIHNRCIDILKEFVDGDEVLFEVYW